MNSPIFYLLYTKSGSISLSPIPSNFNGDKYGAYRDKDGKLYVVDITCTHLGCELKFNSFEKSWDCPCHGSRFSYDGSILNGPALKPLKLLGMGDNDIDPDLV